MKFLTVKFFTQIAIVRLTTHNHQDDQDLEEAEVTVCKALSSITLALFICCIQLQASLQKCIVLKR